MKSKERLIVTLVALFLFAATSVGYALYNVYLNTSGHATFAKNGKVAITNATLFSYSNLDNPQNPTYTDDHISFSLKFTVARNQAAFNKEYSATYEITIANNSFYDYNFSASTFTPSAQTEANTDMIVSYTLDGIEIGETIPSGSSKTFKLKIIMYPQNYGSFTVEGESGVDLEEETDSGSLIASIPRNSTGDLTDGHPYTVVTATVINTYSSEKNFSFSVTNNKFNLTDSSGNPLGSYTIGPNETKTYDIYIRLASGATFPSNTQTMNIYFNPADDSKTSMGVITISVDEDPTIIDNEPPTVSNVIATFQPTQGSVLVTYNGSDNVGIKNYIIETYNSNNILISTNQTEADETSYTVTGLSDGTYYFKVTATDFSNLTATAQSTSSQYRWTMRITNSLTNASSNGASTVTYGAAYDATISGTGNYNSPASLTITDADNNELVAGTDYTYDSSNGSLHIKSVTSDLKITGSGRSNGCLIKGTKVLLADNTYKNIEDINYDDLLMVWNYDTGKLTKEYPLWIENEHKTDSYTKISFDDNTSINVVTSHSFFSYDINKFVDFRDKDNFKVGTSVAKLDDNGKISKVHVTNIEEIKENTTYYFVASTRYYNIITGDFITTDGYVDITNLYKFNNDISWDKNRVVRKVRYEYLKDVLPYYMYKGFRAEEFGVLMNKGLSDINMFKNYIKTYITNTDMLKPPIIKNNKRYWMVTNSYDNVINKDDYLVKEGSYYKLPKIKNVKYWYSTSENKKYKSGAKVKVYTGMHFEAIK